VYDSRLTDSQPQAVGADTAARPMSAADVDASRDTQDGDAGEAGRDAQTAITTSEVHCGDGRVTGGEKCDIAIAAGMPGACPTECPALAPCNPRALNNSGCQAECVVLEMVCMNGDGCCSGNCTVRNDNDCSSSCGDGVIQAEFGETCEQESNTPCKKADVDCDDKDPCTADKLIGSAKNCNALCMNSKVTTPNNGDGCCSSGSDANTDDDCKPTCGNHIREAGEDCDGTIGCSARCKLTLQADQIACLEKLGTDGDECAKCSCMNCASSYLACRSDADANASQLCNDVLECARTNNCYGSACYCGDALLCTPPSGPCIPQVQKAAGTTDQSKISARLSDTTLPLGRSYAADTCRNQQCLSQCR
jgi:hypothetical protein